MKLKQLTIHNIASIEDAYIDFTTQPLADSELFLITGNTGAGKSTILDAICLALYANTPRMRNSKMQGVDTNIGKITDTIQLMRRNTKEAYVNLTFLGNDGNDYEAQWLVERKRTNFTRRWILKNITQPNQSPDEGNGVLKSKDEPIMTAIKRAIGLDFDQFCRTTMLAQGDFTRFLNSDDKEKAEILEQITGTDIYSIIGAKVFNITSNYEKEFKSAKDKIADIQLLTEEQLAEYKQRLEIIEQDQRILGMKLQRLKAKQQWIETDDKLTEELNLALKHYQSALKNIQSEEYNSRKLTINQWEKSIDARRWYTEIKQAQQTIDKQTAELNKAFKTYTHLLQGQAFIKREIQNIEKQLMQFDTKQLENELTILNQYKEELQNNIVQVKNTIEDYGLQELRSKNDSNKQIIINLERIKEAISDFDDVKNIHENIVKENNTTFQHLTDINKQIKKLESKLIIANAALNARSQVLQRQKDTVNDFAKTLRARLVIGDECPICKQQVSELHNEDEWQVLVKYAQDDFDKAQNEYNSISNELNAAKASQKVLNDNYLITKHKIDNDIQLQNSKNRLTILWRQCFDNRELNLSTPISQLYDIVEQQKDNIKLRIEQLKEQIAQGEQKEQHHRQLLSDLATIQERIVGISNKLAKTQALETDITNKHTNLKQINLQFEQLCCSMTDWKEMNLSEIEPIEIKDLPRQITVLQSAVDTALVLLHEASKKIEDNKVYIANFLHQNTELNENRLNMLNSISLHDIEKIRFRLREQETEVEKNKATYESFYQQISNHKKNKPQFEDNENKTSINSQIVFVEQHNTQMSEQRGSINQIISTNNDNMLKQQHLIDDMLQRKELFERWERLNKLIGDAQGYKFRKIAQGYILSHLVQSANLYMQRLSSRYTLHSVPGTFVIMVEDAYQGYITRPTSTISGGESFLVSLALALALSDIGQNLKVDTLFIDEGFGTLSGEPLQKAIETLQSLHRHTGRQVGIISHIEELRERIPVQLQLHQESNTSSSHISIVG